MQQADKAWWCWVAVSGALMVALGAYAAHGLAARASSDMVSAVETGVRYQAWHTLAMLAVLVWRAQRPRAGQRLVLTLWLLGTLGFCGSLYAMALFGLNVGVVTPIGGVALIGGWLALLLVVAIARD
ncbi:MULTISPECIES: DUF423 domain-containing protein [unclassified Halomonas]|uniref:DUF423 domain-containing protein n=1 Tax=unclassified Halomonas TaxID=2609666 RepID=UPI0021E4F045|nr:MULTISPECIES: DUF423 domain-containing protein [unclassified Halomonas]UYF99782.1 DUF423 domain-containing protein [Halomonas sp. GD1P12]WNL42474.1 DUF423 domain-containing protein [Halomonas sp. PAMB 3264]